jgi:Fe-S cluster assembly iron-binding protein IscA
MRRTFRVTLFAIGGLFLLAGAIETASILSRLDRLDPVSRERLPWYIVGLFWPGALCLIVAMVFRERRPTSTLPTGNRRNIVEFTPAAADFAKAAIHTRHYPEDTVLRIAQRHEQGSGFEVRYDLPSSEGADWIGETQGLMVVVEKAIADELNGVVVDMARDQYVFIASAPPARQ